MDEDELNAPETAEKAEQPGETISKDTGVEAAPDNPERRKFFKRATLGAGGVMLGGGASYGAAMRSLEGFESAGPEIDDGIFKPMDQRDVLLTFVHSKKLNEQHPERNRQYNRLQDKDFEFTSGFREMYGKPWDNSKPGYTQMDRALQLAGWHPLEVAGSRYSANLQPNTPLHSWDQSDVASEQFSFESKEMASNAIKSAARMFGVVKCGITPRDRRWDYDPLYDPIEEKELSWEDDFPFEPKTVIVICIPEDYDCVATAPAWTADGTYGDGYTQMGVKADQLARFIRGLGYHAVSAGNDLGNSVAYGVMAGLGEGGRNAQLLVPGFGPRVRIAKIYTDLDFVEYDTPRSWGITEFCLTCGKCAEACPSDALPLPEDKNGGYDFIPVYEHSDEPGYTWNNQPGVKKFYTDAKKCYNFWVENGGACGNCIAACTFNEPDYWHHWFIMAINPVMPSFIHGAMAEAHPAFGYGSTNNPAKVEKFWQTGQGMRVNAKMKHNIGTSNKS